MRKRNIAIMFRLNRKEAEALDKKVKKSGLNREAYLRQVITGIVPRDAPPPDYYSMMRELHKVGNNLNQIAQKAHVLNVMDVQRYDAAVRLFEQTVKDITESEKNKQREVKEMSTNFDSMLNVSAVPQDDRTAAFIAESKNNRNRCYELSEQITAAVATDSQMFQKYLDVQSRFDRYTASNSLLILAQRPEAQKLGDYSYWRSQGTFVKRQERDNPVLILEPGKEYEREDGSIGTYYNAKKLYEPSQTSLRNYTQDKPQVTEQQLIRALLSNPPVNIVPAEPDQMPEGKGALFAPDEKCIYVRKGMDAQSIFLSLSPELALAGFADGNKMYDRDAEAFHAYCASYMLCKKYGIDTQYFDFSHAPEFFENMESQEVRAELAKAQESFKHINARMEKSLQQERNQTERQQPHMGSHSQREDAR